MQQTWSPPPHFSKVVYACPRVNVHIGTTCIDTYTALLFTVSTQPLGILLKHKWILKHSSLEGCWEIETVSGPSCHRYKNVVCISCIASYPGFSPYMGRSLGMKLSLVHSRFQWSSNYNSCIISCSFGGTQVILIYYFSCMKLLWDSSFLTAWHDFEKATSFPGLPKISCVTNFSIPSKCGCWISCEYNYMFCNVVGASCVEKWYSEHRPSMHMHGGSGYATVNSHSYRDERIKGLIFMDYCTT